MSARVLAAATALLLTTVAGAQPFNFTRIAGSGDTMPGSPNGEKLRFLDPPALSAGRVAFVGVRDPFMGVYEWQDGITTKVADTTTPIPGTTDGFTNFAFASSSGERLAFNGANVHNTSSDVRGIYRRAGGTLGRIVDDQQTAPNGGRFSGIGEPHAQDDSVAFFSQHTVGQNTLPAVYRWDSGTVTTVADTNTAVPGGAGNFQNLQYNTVRLDHGAAWFKGYDAVGKTGIYRRDVNGLQADIDTHTDGPAGMGKFISLVEFGPDGDDVLFRGATEIGNPNQGGVFTRINGQMAKLFSTGDPAPGGGTLGTMTSLTLDGGVAVFYDNTNSVIYTNFGGTLKRIIGNGDTLDGKTISSVNFVPAGRDGNRVGFSVIFTDHAPPENYDQAVYVVTLPAPGAAFVFAGAALWGARRRR